MTEILAIDQIGFPILSTLILIPVIAAVALQFAASTSMQRQIAFAGAGLELLLAVLLLSHFDTGSAAMQFVERTLWIPSLGSHFHLGIDGISVLFVPLTALVVLLAMLSTPIGGKSFSRFHWTSLLLFEAVTVGIYTSLDLVMFFVFWELILIPSYFLIRLWGVGAQRQAAAIKYVIYMLVGSAPILIAIVALSINYADAVAAGTAVAGGNFDFLKLQTVPVSAEWQTIIFFLLFFGFAVKGPIPPFHTWLPAVLMEGPAGMAILLVGLKLGTYGMLRFLLPLLPAAALDWHIVMSWFGVAAILYGGFIALAQANLRRLLAFASVSHVGLVLLGIFSLNAQGLQGSVMAMVNMGLTSTALMFLAGALYRRTGSTELSSFGGIARHAPRLAFFFFVFALATIGMPGTSGFVGEFSILWSAFLNHWLIAAVAVTGVILSAGYMLWYYERAFFGPATSAAVRQMRDLTGRELIGVTGALALVLFIGIYPKAVMDYSSQSAVALAQRFETMKQAQAQQPLGARVAATSIGDQNPAAR